MKTAISIPDPLFKAAEQTAKRLRVSRSELYRRALESYLRERDEAAITEALNRVYESTPARLDPVIQELQFRALPEEEW